MIGILVLTVCGPTQGVGQLLLSLAGFVASTIALYAIQREKHAQYIEPEGHGRTEESKSYTFSFA
jgi:uncharacterized membrane protein